MTPRQPVSGDPGRPSAEDRSGDSTPELSIVIVTFNSADWIEGCLASLPAGGTNELSSEIIVVDNASTDGTDAILADLDVDVRLTLETNVGFARAANLGAEWAQGRFLVLLNPDATTHPGSLTELHRFAVDNPGGGIYGGRAFSPDGNVEPGTAYGSPTVWSAVSFALGLSSLFRRSRLFDPESLGSWQRDTVREVDVVTGCIMLVPRSVWASLGGFDPRFFMYSEDVDLATRARRLGWRPTVTPAAAITHAVAASSATPAARMVLILAGRATFYIKHLGRYRAAVALSALRLGVDLRAFTETITAMLGGGNRSRRGRGKWRSVRAQRTVWMSGYPEPTSERVANGDHGKP